MPKTKRTPELEAAIITEYLGGDSIAKIAKSRGHDGAFIASILNHNNIPRRPAGYQCRKYPINETFFDLIDTEAKAYFLGLLYADGCNHSNNTLVSIGLQEQDRHILERFRDLICPTHPLLFTDRGKEGRQNRYTLRLNSRILTDKLTALGCTPVKSLTLQFPDYIPDHLLHHFVRGYFDGDGCISYSIPKISKIQHRDYHWNMISSVDFCRSLEPILEAKTGINVGIKISKTKNGDQFGTLTSWGNKQTVKFLTWLYQDATIFLLRKHEIYLECLRYNGILSQSANQSSSSNAFSPLSSPAGAR
jgi:hypothetical protein